MKKNPFPPRIAPMFFPVPEETIMARLGYSRWRTVLSGEEKQHLASRIAGCFQLCRPCGCWTALPITGREEAVLHLAGGDTIASAGVSARYPEAAWMWFGAVTIGSALPAKSAEWMQAGHSAEAVIADAVGGESADAAMDFLQKQAAGTLRHWGMHLAERRFSPGYGDWDLSGQKLFFELLPLEELGIRLTDSLLMVPEKSVTAVAGIICGSK